MWVGGEELIFFDVWIIIVIYKDLGEEVKAGWFREDFYYRFLGLMIELFLFRDCGNDVFLLANLFLKEF